MTPADAEKIISKSPSVKIENETLSLAETIGKAIEAMRKYGEAQGYLEGRKDALEEVKELVETIEFNLAQECQCPNHQQFKKHACPCTLHLLEVSDAISKYREAVK